MTLANFVNQMSEDQNTLVVIGERTHWIFDDNNPIDQSFAEDMDIVEVIDEKATSAIVRAKYNIQDYITLHIADVYNSIFLDEELKENILNEFVEMLTDDNIDKIFTVDIYEDNTYKIHIKEIEYEG